MPLHNLNKDKEEMVELLLQHMNSGRRSFDEFIKTKKSKVAVSKDALFKRPKEALPHSPCPWLLPCPLFPRNCKIFPSHHRYHIMHNGSEDKDKDINSEEFPKELGNLKGLIRLDLSHNGLEEVPKEIGTLGELGRLYLSHNSLEEVPKEIGNLKRLTYLHLSNNLFTELPARIENLEKRELSEIDLRSNPLQEHGDTGKTLGWRDLHRIFGNNAIFSEDISDLLYAPAMEKLYAKLDARPISWNREELKKIQIESVPSLDLDGKDILNIWGRLKDHAEKSGLLEDYSKVEDYFKNLCAAQDNPEGQKHIRDLTGAVLTRMEENIRANEAQGVDELAALLCTMNIDLGMCTHRQLMAMEMIYSKLYCRSTVLGSFEDFIRAKLAVLKDTTINAVFCPPEIDQNVHVLHYWKHRLRNDLGTGVEYSLEDALCLEIDPFQGNKAEALEEFYSYSCFIPCRAIVKIRDEINDPKSKKRLCEAGLFLMGDTCVEQDYAYIRRLFDFENWEQMRSPNPASITSEGVKNLLVKMGILKATQATAIPC